jgi:hypothetical protein
MRRRGDRAATVAVPRLGFLSTDLRPQAATARVVEVMRVPRDVVRVPPTELRDRALPTS